ncbi:deoxyribonuclease IV [[Eubacterium] cellulosolvens]
MKIGAHISIRTSLDVSVDRALQIGCNTFQIFTRNPRGWISKPLSPPIVQKFVQKVNESHLNPIFAHMPYLPNLGSGRNEVYTKSVMALEREIRRCTRLQIPYLVTHLGSHLGAGQEIGKERVLKAIDRVLPSSSGKVIILLENSAGTLNSVGSSFKDIADIIKKSDIPELLGVCIDTCHAFAQGYDLRTITATREFVKSIDKLVGINKVKLIHANDSKGDLGSHIDRHEHIGLGRIGIQGFRSLISHPILRNVPIIIETPDDGKVSDLHDLSLLRRIWIKTKIKSEDSDKLNLDEDIVRCFDSHQPF